ncbi:hypothetical protein L0E83_05300 [Marichromatium gracile]|uniref:PulJ/GspJ family protein n=1 Tax=Marichromatium gracile TaxID=1048 RepID=UPI001F1A003F|nr:hypothetical protein [Marichromatium gracile]MCF1182855.1 hypothetical protein [Marichromatium gracile]
MSPAHSHPSPQPPRPRPPERGFGLIEMLLILTFTASAIWGVMYLTQQTRDRNAEVKGQALLELADRQLLQFMVRERRLPCPDGDGDGHEDCAVDKGYLPYRTLGMAAGTYSAGEVPLLYGVYRDSAGIDLTRHDHFFHPRNSDGTEYPFTDGAGHINLLDYCMALDTAAGTALDTALLHTEASDGAQHNVAYALAVPGRLNADGQGSDTLGLYDGLNQDLDRPVFHAPGTPLTRNRYDDSTLVRGFAEVEGVLTCDIVRRSLNLMADALAVQQEVCDFTNSNVESAFLGTILAGVGTARSAVDIYSTGTGIGAATEQVTESGVQIARSAATCIPPFVLPGCVTLPIHTAALVLASTGTGLASAALGLSAVTTAAAGVYTVQYGLIYDKIKAGCDADFNPPEAPAPDFSDKIAELGDDLAQARADLAAARIPRDAAQARVAERQGEWDAATAAIQPRLDAMNARIPEQMAPWLERLGDLDPDLGADPAVEACMQQQIEDGATLEDARAACGISQEEDPGEPGMIIALNGHVTALEAELSAQRMIDISQEPCDTGKANGATLDSDARDSFCSTLAAGRDARADARAQQTETLAQADAQKTWLEQEADKFKTYDAALIAEYAARQPHFTARAALDTAIQTVLADSGICSGASSTDCDTLRNQINAAPESTDYTAIGTALTNLKGACGDCQKVKDAAALRPNASTTQQTWVSALNALKSAGLALEPPKTDGFGDGGMCDDAQPCDLAQHIQTLYDRYLALGNAQIELSQAQIEVDRLTDKVTNLEQEIEGYRCGEQGKQYDPDSGQCIARVEPDPGAIGADPNPDLPDEFDDVEAPSALPDRFESEAGLEILGTADELGTGR